MGAGTRVPVARAGPEAFAPRWRTRTSVRGPAPADRGGANAAMLRQRGPQHR